MVIPLSTASLVDLDQELLDGLPPEHLAPARERMLVTVATLEPGEWAPEDLGVAVRRAFAIVVVEGLLIRDHVVGDRTTSELLGPGDIVGHRRLPDELLPVDVRWSVAQPSRIALLDERMAIVWRIWPTTGVRLLARVLEQSTRLAEQRAISHLPRVEDRLLGLFLQLGERWGRIGTGGIIVPITLTHATLGRLIGARRPTVSLALKDLASRGLLERRSDGAWIVSHAARGILHTGGEMPGTAKPSFLVASDDHAHAAPTAIARTLRPMDLALLHSRLADLRRNHARSVDTVAASLDRSRALCEEIRHSRELRSRRPPGAAP